MWPNGLVRRALLEAGRRLVARGLLHDLGTCSPSAKPRSPPPSPATRTSAPKRPRGRPTASAADADGAPAQLGDDEGPPPDPQLFPAAIAELLRAVLMEFELEQAFTTRSSSRRAGPARAPGVGSTLVHRARLRRCVRRGSPRPAPAGDVLVTAHTTPAFEAIMPVAGALVTDHGGLMGRAALVCREYGIPAVIGVAAATTHIPDGATVTVDPAAGRVTIERRDPGGRHAAARSPLTIRPGRTHRPRRARDRTTRAPNTRGHAMTTTRRVRSTNGTESALRLSPSQAPPRAVTTRRRRGPRPRASTPTPADPGDRRDHRDRLPLRRVSRPSWQAGAELALRNQSAGEVHELVAMRLPDGEARPAVELVALPKRSSVRSSADHQRSSSSRLRRRRLRRARRRPPPRARALRAHVLHPDRCRPGDYLDALDAHPGQPPVVPGGPPRLTAGMYGEVTVR